MAQFSSGPLNPSANAGDSQATGNRMKTYKIGELAQITSNTTRTLRYYEELGLLEPVRNTSGQRLYGEDALTRLGFIGEL